jgi:signal peptidase II
VSRGVRSRRVRLLTLTYGLAATAYVIDRLTKAWAERSLQGHEPIVLIPKVLDLSYTTNSGGAFSLFGSVPWLFFGASVGISLVLVWYSRKVTRALAAAGLGLVIGGAIGNLTDRIVRGSGVSGRVVDFIHLQLWPTFNVADSSIVIGAGILILSGVLGGSEAPTPAVQADA